MRRRNMTSLIEAPPVCKCGCGVSVEWHSKKAKWKRFASGHYRKNAIYKSEAWLRDQYLSHRRNIGEIAAECGVNITTIIHHMDHFGIDRRTTQESLIGVQSGAKNPAWKGGTTPERQRLYKSQEWKALLKSVYARDQYTCQRCQQGVSGTGKRATAAHHIKSWSDYPELRSELSNLITLCRVCHLWVHSLANTNRELLG